MLGAALAAATAVALEGDRLTIAFPADAAFVKKKAEQGRELVAGAVRGLTGHAVVDQLRAQRRRQRPAGAGNARSRAADRAPSCRVRCRGSIRRNR